MLLAQGKLPAVLRSCAVRDGKCEISSGPYPVQVDRCKDCAGGAGVASLGSTAFCAVSLVISRSLVQDCSTCCNVKTCVSRL